MQGIIRSRIISNTSKNIYYFKNPINIDDDISIFAATSNEIYYCGDIVNVNNLSKGWGEIVGLISDENRTHDCKWFTDPDDDLISRFPVPNGPLKTSKNIETFDIWKNNDGAIVEVKFIQSFWSKDIFDSNRHELYPPKIEFIKITIPQNDDWHMNPHGYMHIVEEVPTPYASNNYVQDDFTKKIDEYYIARLWDGETPSFGKFKMPGIGGSIQNKYFTKPVDEILGKTVYYA